MIRWIETVSKSDLEGLLVGWVMCTGSVSVINVCSRSKRLCCRSTRLERVMGTGYG